MTGMDDLITWLRAIWNERERQLDDDERVARALAGATIFVSGVPNFYGVGGPSALDYWDRFTPARVLDEIAAERRDIDAKRRIIDLHPYANLLSAPESCESCAAIPGPCVTLRLLALPYATRPGYRDEWRP